MSILIEGDVIGDLTRSEIVCHMLCIINSNHIHSLRQPLKVSNPTSGIFLKQVWVYKFVWRFISEVTLLWTAVHGHMFWMKKLKPNSQNVPALKSV